MGVFKVSDMTCGHCEKVIKKELMQGNPEVEVSVDLKDKILKVENLPDDRVIFLLEELGYTPERINKS